MPEECPDCGGTFASPADLLNHVTKAHGGGDAKASLAMNPESQRRGLVCALCGHRFSSPAELARHNLEPHPGLVTDRTPAEG